MSAHIDDVRPGQTAGGLTVLTTDDRHTASKVYAKNGHGYRKLKDYDLGFLFGAVPTDADNLEQLAEIITDLRQHQRAVIVRGGLDDAYWQRLQDDPHYRITRRKNDKADGLAAHITEVPRNWIMVDVDGYPLPPDADLAGNPQAVVEQAIRDLLPPEFHDADCFWQLSSSCGLVDGIFKMHAFFWLSEAHSNKHLRRWMKWNAPHVDTAPFSANQPHFIADAQIENGDDPLPQRTGFIHKQHVSVAIAPLTEETVKAAKRERRANATSGKGNATLFARSLTDALAHLGDADRQDGFHRPLLAAGMAYARVCAKGRARDDEAVKAAMREAIENAPKRADRDVQNYVSDSYLDAQIAGAIQLIANENSDAPQMEMPRGYGWTNAGLWYCKPKGKDDEDYPDPEWVCGIFHTVGICENGDGGEWGTVLRWTDARNHPHTWIIGADAIQDTPKEIAKMLAKNGLRCSSSTHPQLRRFLERLNPERQLTAVTSGGWHNGNSFVLADGTIFGASDLIMRPDIVQNTDSCGVAGTLDQWNQHIGRLCVGNSRLALFVSAAFAGHLLEIVVEPSGGFHIHGISQSGKSTAGFCAGSVGGKGGRGYNVHQWATTANGLEAKAALSCDGCLVLDEIGQGQAGDAGSQIYRLCNESGKMRMTKEITARKTEKWRLIVLSTGEVTLQQRMQEAGKPCMTGTEVRLTNIEADAGAGFGVFDTLHEFDNGGALADHLRDAAKTYYGTPGRAFLAALVDLRRDDPDGLYQIIKQARQQFMDDNLPDGADGQVRSVCGRFGVVAFAGEMAITTKVLNWPEGEATRAAKRCFDDWVRARGTVGAGEKQIGIRAVRHFLELHGSARFQEITTMNHVSRFADAPEHLSDIRINNQAGYKQDDGKRMIFMVTQEVWKNEVCKGQDADLVARTLADEGWLIRDGNHLARLKRLPDQKRMRLYHVTSDILGVAEE